jgi:nitrogen fixation protein NifB
MSAPIAYVNFADLKSRRTAIAQPESACGTAGGANQSRCGSGAIAGDLAPEVWEKVKNHPCYSEDAHHHYARMHVAVAPACNIQCNYCNRKYDCSNESRPGVVSERLTPEQAAKKALAVASEIPQMTVLGIAGPGDALANPQRTFRTFDLVRAAAPDIRLCLSTNGLALPDHVDEIVRRGVDHVTITINMVDPDVGARIYPWIYFDHRRITGREAAQVLSRRQLQGLEMLAARGVLVKVNSVMIPGINDQHLIEVNRAIKARGAFLHNVMPLISAPEHGTRFGLAGQRGPTAQELKSLQDACEGGARMMRHCRQCRADAVGMLGEDRSAEFSTEKVESREVVYDLAARRAHHAKVEAMREAQRLARKQAQAEVPADVDLRVLVAVATRGEGRINQHFGHAHEFQVHEVTPAGTRFVGHRRVDHYCQGGYGDEDALPSVIAAINDCHAVFVAKIGRCPKAELVAAGIEPVDRFAHAFIEASLLDWFKAYARMVATGEVRHATRGDAQIRQGAFVAA